MSSDAQPCEPQRPIHSVACAGIAETESTAQAIATIRGRGPTWVVGSAEDVARSLRKYRDLGISQFVLSDTPYLPEIRRQGD